MCQCHYNYYQNDYYHYVSGVLTLMNKVLPCKVSGLLLLRCLPVGLAVASRPMGEVVTPCRLRSPPLLGFRACIPTGINNTMNDFKHKNLNCIFQRIKQLSFKALLKLCGRLTEMYLCINRLAISSESVILSNYLLLKCIQICQIICINIE